MNLHPYAEKLKHHGTKQKIYIPYISGKRLHVWWHTRTKAELYAKAVLARYYKKLRIHIEYIKAKRPVLLSEETQEKLKAKENKDAQLPVNGGREENPIPEQVG